MISTSRRRREIDTLDDIMRRVVRNVRADPEADRGARIAVMTTAWQNELRVGSC